MPHMQAIGRRHRGWRRLSASNGGAPEEIVAEFSLQLRLGLRTWLLFGGSRWNLSIGACHQTAGVGKIGSRPLDFEKHQELLPLFINPMYSMSP